MNIREHFSKAGRQLAEEKLNWNLICKQWDNVLSTANIDKNRPYPQINYPKQQKLEDFLEKEKNDRLLYVMPGTYGDVFLSTAVVDSIKKQNPTKDIYFAVAPQFASVLDGNPNIFKVIPYADIFNNIPLMNTFFAQVYTPAQITQMTNNWQRSGKHVLQVYADHCGVTASDLFMQVLEYQKPIAPEYVVVHTTTGQEAKNYLEFQKVINRIGLPVIQVGTTSDQLLKGVIDLRGKKIQETAGIIKKAKLFIGCDSICGHIAAYVGTKSIILYGSTIPKVCFPLSDIPNLVTILEPANRFGCEVPCHVSKCSKSPTSCVNNISVDTIIETVQSNGVSVKEPTPPTLSGYTTTFNPDKYYPWRESIKSMLAICDEVVVVDGGSTDGTLEELQNWKKTEAKLKVFKRKWRMDEPAMDGMMKAYARALCTKEFCWQQDCDEIIHELDYPKITNLLNTFPAHAKLVILPVIDLYGSPKTVRTDRGLYKARLSKNLPEITHGIPNQLRQTNVQGKIFCDKDLSDGCEYINSQTFNMIDGQVTFYNQQLFDFQQKNTPEYKAMMTDAYKKFPSIWHFSWNNLERRMKVDQEFWDAQWARLNSKDIEPENRFFPGVKRADITPELIKERAEFLKDKKLDESPMDLLYIDWLDLPNIIKDWKYI